MSKAELIARINALSEAEMTRVAPYLEADLAALSDLGALQDEVARGRASARDQAMVDDEDLVEEVRKRLDRAPA